jgi:hypothetical protein
MAKTQQKLCNHVKTNGSICKAVALEDQDYCYFHHRDRSRMQSLSTNFRNLRSHILHSRGLGIKRRDTQDLIYADECAAAMDALQLPALEDAESIQIVITNVVRALASQQIEFRAAGLMLYAAQIASSNLNRIRIVPSSTDVVALNDPEPLPTFGTPYRNSRENEEALDTGAETVLPPE